MHVHLFSVCLYFIFILFLLLFSFVNSFFLSFILYNVQYVCCYKRKYPSIFTQKYITVNNKGVIEAKEIYMYVST